MADFVFESGIKTRNPGPGPQRTERPDERFDVLGIPVSVTTLDDATARIERWADDNRGRMICIRDVHGVMRAQDDPELMALHQSADMVTPDGMPLVLLGKLKGLKIERTCGPDLMEQVCARSPASGLKHYFYGGQEGIALALAEHMEHRFPGLRIAGHECPPFRPLTQEEDDAVVDRINASGADIVWVGLSTPKQEMWMRDHRARLGATLIGVGAAFDFHTGRVERAPEWMQRHTLEWLHRLLCEPRRLWRRYLLMAPKFVILSAMQMLSLQAGRGGSPR